MTTASTETSEHGRAAVVTGGASGLGRATVEALAARGDHVFALDLDRTSDEVTTGVTHLAVDVSDPDAVESVMQLAADRCAASGVAIRTVVNCAGIAPSHRVLGRSGIHDLAAARRTIEVNLLGTLNVLVHGAAIMQHNEPVKGERGVIVNTASIAAFDGQVGQVAYAATKGGITALTLPAARDLGRYGIRVCTIAPGIMASPMTEVFTDELREQLRASIPFPSRLGTPAEFAQLVTAIADHPYLNGEVIRMDGAARLPYR